MGAVTGVKDGLIFEDHDGRFNGIESGTTMRENLPAGRGLSKAVYAPPTQNPPST